MYYDPTSPSAFSSKEKVFRSAKRVIPTLTRRDVNSWFDKQLTYTLHKPMRHSFTRNPTIVMSIDDQWQADLVDMSSRAKDNDGYTFLLTVIDCFSKYAWVEPVPRKTGTEILNALKRIIVVGGRNPKRLQTDDGKEFTNSLVQSFLKQRGIAFFTTKSEMKSAIVERFNRTLKDKMWKWFTAHNTTRYTNVLPSLVEGYNNSKHRSIGMAPSVVTTKDENVIRQRLYGKLVTRKRKKYKYSIGDLVRISKARKVFRKGYLPNWSDETFLVKDRNTRKEPVYYLQDYDGEDIEGAFYEKELQRVTEQAEYRVQEILKSKKKGGKILHFVKWHRWPSKFNSWVEDTLIRDL